MKPCFLVLSGDGIVRPAIGGSDRSGFEKAHRCLRVLQVDCFVWRAEGSINLSRSFLFATWEVYCTGLSYVLVLLFLVYRVLVNGLVSMPC